MLACQMQQFSAVAKAGSSGQEVLSQSVLIASMLYVCWRDRKKQMGLKNFLLLVESGNTGWCLAHVLPFVGKDNTAGIE